MKQYLLTGIAALAIGAGFTACSDHDFDVVSGDQAVVQSYNDAFIRVFGQPAADHTWGFSSEEFPPSKVTRATGEFADHIGDYPDANMWTSKGFLAPDPLTRSQELRAQYYFQMNHITNPQNDDYGTIDFFMQQVYDGGTDPMPGKSPEVYLAADNSTWITSGEHMDHLTSGDGENRVHMYNFNNGNCSVNSNVANRDQTDVNDTNQQHADKIQLMLNTPTYCFGYANSDASCVRDDRYVLVGAETIDYFCDHDPGFASWLADRLPAGEEDVKCDDEFHRGFIGFDFDMLPDETIFAGTENWEYGKEEYNYQPHYLGKTYSEYDYYRYDLYGAKYHYVSANRNQYCGESQTIDPEPNEEAALNLLDEGWLPAAGSANKTWVKVGGCADGYYSDWIVTFKPASYGDVPTPNLRVIVEDLTATQPSDFDFNDVVFDVYYGDEGKAYLMVQAAGGTLPLTVAGVEVHGLFGYTTTNIMINTNARTGVSGLPAKKIPLDFAVNSPEDVRDLIEIKVTKRVLNEQTGEYEPRDFTIEATTGAPAAKVAVVPTFQWVNERHSMKDDYPSFRDYVLDPNAVWDGNN